MRLDLEIPDELADRLGKPAEAWLDVDAAADYLAAPRSRIYDLVAQDRVEVRRDGKRLLFRREWRDDAIGGAR